MPIWKNTKLTNGVINFETNKDKKKPISMVDKEIKKNTNMCAQIEVFFLL